MSGVSECVKVHCRRCLMVDRQDCDLGEDVNVADLENLRWSHNLTTSYGLLLIDKTRMDQTSPKLLTSLSDGGMSDKLDFLVFHFLSSTRPITALLWMKL